MSSLRRLLPAFSLLAVALLFAPLLRAATKPTRVQASLVAADASVQPGQPITVALRLVHDAHWHTYWLNAGDSGLATQLNWNLPQGLQAGNTLWPLPQKPLPQRW